MKPLKLKILLADDHEIFRQGLKSLFLAKDGIQIVGEAVNGLEAVELFKKTEPDIVIMDISMPELNGLLASKEILHNDKDAKIIILSTHLRDSYVSEALKMGVKGYVLKDSAMEDLVSAIRAVRKGQTYLSPKVTSLTVERMLKGEAFQGAPVNRLSSREQEVLQLLAEGKSNKEIAEILFISPKTVDNHRSSIMKKLDVHDISGIVKYAIREDLIEP